VKGEKSEIPKIDDNKELSSPVVDKELPSPSAILFLPTKSLNAS